MHRNKVAGLKSARNLFACDNRSRKVLFDSLHAGPAALLGAKLSSRSRQCCTLLARSSAMD